MKYAIKVNLSDTLSTWKWRHGDTETSFGFIRVVSYLFLYYETALINQIFSLLNLETGPCEMLFSQQWKYFHE